MLILNQHIHMLTQTGGTRNNSNPGIKGSKEQIKDFLCVFDVGVWFHIMSIAYSHAKSKR